MTKKGLFAIFLIISLLLIVVTVNAMPRIFPSFQLFGGNNNPFGNFDNLLSEPGPRIGFLKQNNNAILIVKAPQGLDWSDFCKGNSQCTLPTGTVMAGDLITDCEETVTIRHIPSNEIAIVTTFTTPSTKDNSRPSEKTNDNNNNNNDQNNQGTVEKEKFEIKITEPVQNKLYIRNFKLKDIDTSLIVGPINIKAEISNPENIELSKVVFNIDGVDKTPEQDGSSYIFRFDEKKYGGSIDIIVSAYDHNNKILDYDEISIRNINLQLL